ncbi:hypothetical protein [Bartonella grahamii]|uniref:hypothetical protein n=1 Tax=Bartonella grahamii TaxID=33045 RepID=UPI00236116BD|nr:hypothetical protein [Bartonella grahamii]
MYIRKSEVEDLWIYALCVFLVTLGFCLAWNVVRELGGGICEWRGKLRGRGVLSCEVCDGEALLVRL